MIKIYKNLYVGANTDLASCPPAQWAFVHATQTKHYERLGWNRTTNKSDKNHPNYIALEENNHLYYNWVDGGASLYELTGPKRFSEALNFIGKWIQRRPVLVHCDQGQSRGPTVALLYLAKRARTIPESTFDEGRAAFRRIYPPYAPGGIAQYVREHWSEIK